MTDIESSSDYNDEDFICETFNRARSPGRDAKASTRDNRYSSRLGVNDTIVNDRDKTIHVDNQIGETVNNADKHISKEQSENQYHNYRKELDMLTLTNN